MYFLSKVESANWKAEAEKILDEKISTEKHKYEFQPALQSAFSFFIGSRFAAEGNEKMGMDWARHGILNEESGLFSNAFLLNFLERHNGKLIMPDKVFADPRPYIHFTTVPSVKNARFNFARQCAKSIPQIKKPLKIMDIGCGDGGMLLLFLDVLYKAGTINEKDPFLHKI